jgi:SAM-dependent methyltransferase
MPYRRASVRFVRIDYADHYDSRYWQHQKQYHDGSGELKTYYGPSLDWEGWEMISATLAKILPAGSLLDIGCGGGGLTARLLRRGFDAYGVDISEHAVDNCVQDVRSRVALTDISAAPKQLAARHGGKVFPATFSNVIATDLLEHLYEEDLSSTFDWMVGKARKSLFFCVATAFPDDTHEFVLKKGAEVPKEFETTAIAGHVNVRGWRYWERFFQSKNLTIRWDLMYLFQMQREINPSWRDTMGWNLQSTWFLDKR